MTPGELTATRFHRAAGSRRTGLRSFRKLCTPDCWNRERRIVVRPGLPTGQPDPGDRVLRPFQERRPCQIQLSCGRSFTLRTGPPPHPFSKNLQPGLAPNRSTGADQRHGAVQREHADQSCRSPDERPSTSRRAPCCRWSAPDYKSTTGAMPRRTLRTNSSPVAAYLRRQPRIPGRQRSSRTWQLSGRA